MSIDEVIENALFDYCKARRERESAIQDRVECDLRATIEMHVEEAIAREREELLDLVDSYAKDNADLKDAIRARAEKETT
jgi:hypothetical protein